MANDDLGTRRSERRLAAILAADVVGYSALMGADEAATVRNFKSLQSALLPLITERGGRLIGTAGDSIVAEFASAINAVTCAISIQSKVAEHTADIEFAKRMRLRIGVNLGDLIFDDGGVYGDGINIAARLEGIAMPGTIYVSDKVYHEMRGKIDVPVQDLGAQTLKNIADPVRVYRLDLAGPRPVAAPRSLEPTLALPDKPSIAILPFTNMSGDPDQEFFGDGIAEDVLTALSKLRWLFAIARNSSFTYRGKAVDVRQVSQELGVRYILEGSVRRAAGRVRVTGQLIDATTGNHVWAERYDRDLTDIFAVQDEIANAVASAIGPAIVEAERFRSVSKPLERLGAWESYQRGMWHLLRANAADNSVSVGLFQRAIDLDPTFGAAYSAKAQAVMRDASIYYNKSLEECLPVGEALARRAVALDENDAIARARVGLAMYLGGKHEDAIRESNDALLIDPNCEFAHGVKGAGLLYSGQLNKARDLLQMSLRLSPRDPSRPSRLSQLAISHYLEREYEIAIDALQDVVRQYPGHGVPYRWLIAAFGQLDKKSEASALIKIAPGGFDRMARHRPTFLRPIDHEHLMDGLRKAGWCE